MVSLFFRSIRFRLGLPRHFSMKWAGCRRARQGELGDVSRGVESGERQGCEMWKRRRGASGGEGESGGVVVEEGEGFAVE
jgi:hypothetical protein